MTNLAAKLQSLAKDITAAKLFHVLGTYQRNMRLTHVDNLAKQANLSEPEIRVLLTKLAELNIGRLVVGRHGKRTRFEWEAPLVDVAALALGSARNLERGLDLQDKGWVNTADPSDETQAPRATTKSYAVPLSGDRHATLQVPGALTKADVEKIRKFIDLFLD